MKITKVMNGNMEVAMVEGGMMIGRCRGPIKAILPVYEERIEKVISTIEPIVEGTSAVDIDIYEGIDMEDYELFCNWMIANGGEPSVEEYRKAIEYYTNNK